MKEYIFKEKTMKVNDKEYNVIIPDKHSNITALIFETRDLNAWDEWANITRYHTLCLVLRKGEKEWETLYDGSTNTFKINGMHMSNVGIFGVLFQLETEKAKGSIRKKEEIKVLKNRIRKDTKRLKVLERRNKK